MRIVFFGTPDFAVPCLEALIRAGHEIAAVVTQPDKPAGRGGKTAEPPVKKLAREHGLAVLQPASVRKPPFAPELAKLAPEIAVVVAYGKILPPELLAVPRRGCVNVHGSLLPRWRGAAPIQWAVLAGDRTSGVTTMQMDEGMDTGDVLLAREVPIARDETAGSLFEKLAPVGAELLVETLRALESGKVAPRPQDGSQATHARMLEKDDGRVDWTKSAIELERHVRGMTPWPGAFTSAAGKLLKVHRVEMGDAVNGGEPGSVIGKDGDDLIVQTGEGRLRLVDVQPEGGKRMRAAEWLRGRGQGVEKLG